MINRAHLLSIRRRQDFRNARPSWTAGEEQDRQDVEWLLERVEAMVGALEVFRDPEFGLMTSLGDPVTVSIDGKNYQCVMSACFFCRAKAAWAKDIQHADDCPIRVVRVALEGADQ